MAHSSDTQQDEPDRGVHVGADGHVHFNDPARERFFNETWKFGEGILANTPSGELSEALETVDRLNRFGETE